MKLRCLLLGHDWLAKRVAYASVELSWKECDRCHAVADALRKKWPGR